MNKHLGSIFCWPDGVNILSHLNLTTQVVGNIIPILQDTHKMMNIIWSPEANK